MREALLALLIDGPRHGYQLKSEFEDATGHGWPLNIGQVYSTLQRLERDGLVEAVPEGDEGDDARRPWKLTGDGHAAVGAWIADPPQAPNAGRDDVSMKLLITLASGAAPVLDVVRDQRASAMGALQDLTAKKAAMTDPSLAEQLQLDRTILLAESQIRWLDLVEERFLAAGARRVPPGVNAQLDSEPNQ